MERGRESGTLAATVDVRQTAQLLMDLYIGVLCRWVRADEAFSLRTELDRMIDLALPGLGPSRLTPPPPPANEIMLAHPCPLTEMRESLGSGGVRG